MATADIIEEKLNIVALPIPLSKMIRIEIPISPLSKTLIEHQNHLVKAKIKYNLSLQKSPPEDLNVLRELIQEIDVEQMYCSRLQGSIDQVSSLSIDYYDVRHFSAHISYYTKLLWNGADPADVLVPSLEKLSMSMFRFLSFQEYLFSFVSLLCKTSDESNRSARANFIIQWAFQSMYVRHDLATVATLADVIESQKIVFDSCSPQSKTILEKLQEVYGERSLIIQEELTNDMVEAHPVIDSSSVIVPNLSIFMKAGIEIYKTNPIGDSEAAFLERFKKLLVSTQYRNVFSDDSNCLEMNESLQHWILSREYSEEFSRPFWNDVCASLPEQHVSIDLKSEPLYSAKSETTTMEAALPAEDDVISNELQKRLAALQPGKK